MVTTTANQARAAIYSEFLGIGTQAADYPILARLRGSDPNEVGSRVLFDNETHKQPEKDTWIRVAIRHTGRRQITLGRIGNRRFEIFANLLVQILTPAGGFFADVDDLALEIQDLFDSKSLSTDGGDLLFEAGTAREVGPDGKWNIVVVDTPFTYEALQ